MRDYSDERIREIIMLHASRPAGTSKVLLKDHLYSYADRDRAGVLIQALAGDGALRMAYCNGGKQRGRGSWRAFVSHEHAAAFSRGEAPPPTKTPRTPRPAMSVGVRFTQPARNDEPLGPVDTSRARFTRCPSGTDFRFTVTGPVPRVVDSSQCSPWARAAAGD